MPSSILKINKLNHVLKSILLLNKKFTNCIGFNCKINFVQNENYFIIKSLLN